MTNAAIGATMGSSSSNEATGRRRPTSLRAQNPEVYYSDDAIVTADDATIAELKRIAAGNPRLRSRLCTHPDPSSGLHEMLIVHHREAYVRPHRHFGKPESFHVIEGTAQVVIFEEVVQFLQGPRRLVGGAYGYLAVDAGGIAQFAALAQPMLGAGG